MPSTNGTSVRSAKARSRLLKLMLRELRELPPLLHRLRWLVVGLFLLSYVIGAATR